MCSFSWFRYGIWYEFLFPEFQGEPKGFNSDEFLPRGWRNRRPFDDFEPFSSDDETYVRNETEEQLIEGK